MVVNTTEKTSEKVVLCGIKKEEGYLYYIDKDGDVSRALWNRGGRPRKKPAA